MTHRLREAILWTGAVLGLLSVVAGAAVLFFGYSFLIFRSGSMGPDIPTGSLALARTTPAAELRAGDVVSVLSVNGARVTHRLVSATVRGDEGSLVLQGDANGAPDQEIYQATEAEVEIASVPYLGYVVTVLLSPAGLIGAGCLSGMLLLVGFGAQDERPGGRSAGVGGRHRGTGRPRLSRTGYGVAAAVAGVAVASIGVSSTSAYFVDTASASSPADAFSSTAIAVPVTPTVTQPSGSATATITWTATPVGTGSATATSYDVLRYTAATGGNAVVACSTTTAVTCTDPAPGTGTVYYAIRAMYSSRWTQEGSRRSFTLVVATAPVTNLRCSPSGLLGLGGAVIAWDAPVGSTPTSYTLNFTSNATSGSVPYPAGTTQGRPADPEVGGNRLYTVTITAIYGSGSAVSTTSATIRGQNQLGVVTWSC